MSIYTENANMAATRDLIPHADLVLDVACKDAVKAIREGRPGWALYRITRAAERAERILGPTDWSATTQRGAS
jgi:hypothetical protein